MGAVHTGARAFYAEIIAPCEMRTYVWKSQTSAGLKNVSQKLHIDLLLALLLLFIRLLFLIILYFYASLSFCVCLNSTITAAHFT